MPVSYVVEPGLIRFNVSGAVTEEDVRGIAAAADEIERASSPVPPRITDLTAVTEFKVGYPEVRDLADRRRAIVFPNDFRSAIVVSRTSQFGMARMFQTLNDNPRITIEIFTDPEKATTWVRG